MDNSRNSSHLRWFLFFGITGVSSLVWLFFQNGDEAFVSMDAPLFQLERFRYCLENSFYHLWFPDYWLGNRYGPIAPDQNALIQKWFHFPFSLNLLFSFNLLMGGVGFYLLLRRLKLNGPACVFGALAFLLTSTNMTLVFPGHINKIMTSAWIPFSVAFFFTALGERRLMDYIISGAFLGLALLGGEVQISYYLGIWYTAWLVFYLVLKRKKEELTPADLSVHTGGLIILAITSLVAGFSTTVHSLRFLSDNTIAKAAEDGNKTWQFATQFYFPPEEMFSFLTTIQFFGAPHAYWGRDGAPTPIRFSDDYMGLLPLGFAIVGAVALWKLWQVRFLVVMAVISLLASFGKEGFVYLLLYQLPTMKSQRNPHRWIYFVAFAVCVLAAYGIHWFWERLHSKENDDPKNTTQKLFSGWNKYLFTIFCTGFVLFAISALFVNSHESIAPLFFGNEALASNQRPLFLERTNLAIASLFRTGFFLALSSGAVWWLIYTKSRLRPNQPKWSMYAPFALLVLIMVTDLGMNNKRYIQFYPWKDRFQNNQIVNFFKQDNDQFRVKVFGFQESMILNDLVSNILPFHQVEVVDPPAASRLPTEYAQIFAYTADHYVRSDRYYDFFNIKYVLSAKDFSDPNIKTELIGKNDTFSLYQRPDFMPRAWLVDTARVVPDRQTALAQTFDSAFPFRQSVVLEEKPGIVPVDAAPLSKSARPSQSVKAVPFKLYESNQLEIETSTDKPAMLVLGEKWDPDWKAWLDDKPVKIYCANFAMRGIELPIGKHQLRMEYRPSMMGFWVSIITLSVVMIGTGIFWLSTGKKSDH